MKHDVKEIFQDNHLLVLNKPAGMLTQPNSSENPSLEGIAKEWLKKRFEKKGNVFLQAVHRIDRPVSGLVVFAKSSKALTRLNASFKSKLPKKNYLAVVEGSLFEDRELVHYLVHGQHCAEVKTASCPEAKLCRLNYSVLKRANGYTLLSIILDTGRYHQIRAQLGSIGHPVVGDRKYGATNNNPAILLHHHRLRVEHPVSKESLLFEAPLCPLWPSEFNPLS